MRSEASIQVETRKEEPPSPWALFKAKDSEVLCMIPLFCHAPFPKWSSLLSSFTQEESRLVHEAAAWPGVTEERQQILCCSSH